MKIALKLTDTPHCMMNSVSDVGDFVKRKVSPSGEAGHARACLFTVGVVANRIEQLYHDICSSTSPVTYPGVRGINHCGMCDGCDLPCGG